MLQSGFRLQQILRSFRSDRSRVSSHEIAVGRSDVHAVSEIENRKPKPSNMQRHSPSSNSDWSFLPNGILLTANSIQFDIE